MQAVLHAAVLAACLLAVVPGGVRAFKVFASLSTLEDVAVFGQGIPLGPHPVHTLATSAPLCEVGGKVPAQQVPMAEFRRTVRCLFDNRVYTAARHVVVQAVRCEHPPYAERESLYGKPVNIVVGEVAAPDTLATYERPPPTLMADPATSAPRGDASAQQASRASWLPMRRQPNQQKRYFLCACLQIWFRAEFLFEWFEYNRVVNGIERFFVYDNDSGIDQLKEMVDFLSRGYAVDVVDWPLQKTQYAFNGHCILRAQRECDWVTLTDIDEFAVVSDKVSPDGSLASFLAQRPPATGGISVYMVNFHDDKCRILKPIGGVVKNYDCHSTKLSNLKPIIRPEAAHPSLFTTAHYLCYAQPFEIERYRIGIQLYHYKSQAWEVLLKKYQRRAGLGTRKYQMADGTDATLDKPSPEFLAQCRCNTTAGSYERTTELYDRFACQRTRRDSAAGCATSAMTRTELDDQPPADLLVTGVGGIGSGMRGIRTWIASHVVPGRRVEDLALGARRVAVGWEYVARSPLPASLPFGERRFRRVVHVVQHPLAAIAAAMTYPHSAWPLIEAETPIVAQDLPLLQRALYHWITWTQLADLFADDIVRIEEANLAELCSRWDLLNCNAALGRDVALRSMLHHSDKAITVTWDHLRAIDPFAMGLARDLAVAYGYNVTGSFDSDSTAASATESASDDPF